MQNQPYVDVVIAFNVEHQIGIALQRPAKPPRQIQLVGVERHTRGRMAADMKIGLFQSIDKTERSLLGLLVKLVADSASHVLAGKGTWHDRLGFHPRAL